MGAHQSDLKGLITNPDAFKNFDLNRLPELRKLLEGHEKEAFQLILEVAQSQRPSELRQYPEYLQKITKKLLPPLIQWMSRNELVQTHLKDLPVAMLLNELHTFIENPNGRDAAAKKLINNMTVRLLTPPSPQEGD
jgi:hypothetical protein